MSQAFINKTQPIKQWIDKLDPELQSWIKDYIIAKHNTKIDLSGIPGLKNYYAFDYRYASEFPDLTPDQSQQLKDIGAEIMFIYDTINHNPIQIKPVSGSTEANQIASNQKFWSHMMKGYLAGQKGDYGIKSIIGPASGGLFIYAPPNSEHKIFQVLSEIEGNNCMVRIDDVDHKIVPGGLSGIKVIHVKVDAMG